MTEKKISTPEELKAALENEKLDDAQLDMVAGGNAYESYLDIQYLQQYCGIPFNLANQDAAIGKLGELYRRAGTYLHARNQDDKPNTYTVYNAQGHPNSISRETALYDLAVKINTRQIFIEDIRFA